MPYSSLIRENRIGCFRECTLLADFQVLFKLRRKHKLFQPNPRIEHAKKVALKCFLRRWSGRSHAWILSSLATRQRRGAAIVALVILVGVAPLPAPPCEEASRQSAGSPPNRRVPRESC